MARQDTQQERKYGACAWATPALQISNSDGWNQRDCEVLGVCLEGVFLDGAAVAGDAVACGKGPFTENQYRIKDLGLEGHKIQNANQNIE